MLYYERKFRRQGARIIIGVDEAGRGPLAGPVVAAAVRLKTTRFKNRIDDSKKLTGLQREHAFEEIARKASFGIGIVDEKIIDYLNIFSGTRLAMEQSVAALLDELSGSVRRDRARVLVDGDVDLSVGLPVTNIIAGDAKSLSIAAASIVAKVTRDRIMGLYDKVFPQYGFIRHKGYPTKEHRKLLSRFGPSEIHRMSFSGV